VICAQFRGGKQRELAYAAAYAGEMPTPDSQRFADDWARAWNAHDVEAVLAHFHDDVVFTSPVAARVLPESEGVVRGKEALRHYWTRALALQSNLHFDVIDVYQGESTLVINYRNHRGELVNEVLTFGGDLVRMGHGTYLEQGS
jgi:hypothetical protein